MFMVMLEVVVVLLVVVLLADPGKARGCSTNSLVIH